MQTIARSSFTTVTTEGAILPADLLQRVADGEVEGLGPTDYYLAPNERLNEAINRSWNRLLGVWEGFEEQRQTLPEHDRGTTLTRERWLLILFDELGFGRLAYSGSILIDEESEVTYPISHAYQHLPIHLISFRQSLDRVDEDRGSQFRRSPHSLMQEFLNRTEQSLWGIVSNGLRVRVLRDNASFTRAAYLEFDLEAMFEGELYADFTLLWLIGHQSRFEILGSGESGVGIGEDDDPTPYSQSPTPSNCWIEKWSQAAAEQGTRALDSLRDGVQDAISRLGRGFLAHPANGELRARLQSGDLGRQDYFRQLLRLVYRLIFLFVAEDRNLLLVPGTAVETRQRYADYYSLSRLRTLAAERRSGPHPDLYRGLRLVMLKLRAGYEPLGLPGLGGFLFSERGTPALDEADIANEMLLDALRALTFTIENGVRRPVDYRNLGAEELGSVYESLLELHPEMNVHAATFNLRTAAGSERKTTGSYYTPTSLINSLLDTALEPVVEDRLKRAAKKWNADDAEKTLINADKKSAKISAVSASSAANPSASYLEEAILNIKVVDPACGSGHFLIAAANRLARHLARIRTGDGEPSPEANREALRDVVGRCIYGVDINEMSVELCRVALWMETLDPGKPLTFLDKNIQCGNSLMGATPALLAEGIPDEAFTPITGDDKAYCNEWKKRNREQRKGQLDMFSRGDRPWERLGNFAQAMREMEAMGDETLAGVEAQQAAYERLVSSSEYEYGKLWADAWVAAFVWRKRPEGKPAADGQDGFPYPITEQVFREIEQSPFSQPKWLRDEITRLAKEYQFFHWHLAFPQFFTPGMNGTQMGADEDSVTGWEGGFDVVLGNPPWDQIQMDAREFFASRLPEIANASTTSERNKKIKKLSHENPIVYKEFLKTTRLVDGVKHFIHVSERYPLTSYGRLNTAPLFTEQARQMVHDRGRVGIVVPTGIATDSFNKYFFADLIDNKVLVSLYSFYEIRLIFPDTDSRNSFCLLTLTGSGIENEKAKFVFLARNVEELKNPGKKFTLTGEEISLINPNTKTCPIFPAYRDAEITKNIYKKIPVLAEESPQQEISPWGFSSMLMFMMNTSSHLFQTYEDLTSEGYRLDENSFVKDGSVYLPLFEGKMIYQYDHRFVTYHDDTFKETSQLEHKDAKYVVRPRYWINQSDVMERIDRKKDWFVGFRDITNNSSSRTSIFSVVPSSGIGNTLPIVFLDSKPTIYAAFIANANSFVFDYLVRQKVGGIHLNFYILKQIPILPPSDYSNYWLNFIFLRVLELVYTAWDLSSFGKEFGYIGPPFIWDNERRLLLQSELDAAYFHFYNIEHDDVDYIMESFNVLKDNDVKKYDGRYRSKQVILEIYDEMANALASNQPYQSRLNPPPAHPNAAHPWDEAFLGPELPVEQWWEKKWDADDADGAQINADKTDKKRGVVREPGVRWDAGLAADDAEKALINADKKAEKNQRQSAAAAGDQRHQRSIQTSLITTEFNPPTGGYSQRLKRVMALGNSQKQGEVAELVAALGDENGNIRWLAGSSLVRLRGRGVRELLIAYLATEPGEPGESEARRVLELIEEVSE